MASPSKRQHSALQLEPPPFASPTKGMSVKKLKKEESKKEPHRIIFQRVGNKQNNYIVYALKPNNDAGYMYPIQLFIDSDDEQSLLFKQHTGALAPLVSRRIHRRNNVPLKEKRHEENSYPFRCLYCQKTDAIDHDTYMNYVLDTVKKIINQNSKYITNFKIDLIDCDHTISGPVPLDHVITDKGIQTIIYRYHFADYLNDDTYDEDTKTYVLPENITKTFYQNNQEIAHNYFSPYEGEYSEIAQKFGFPESQTNDQNP